MTKQILRSLLISVVVLLSLISASHISIFDLDLIYVDVNDTESQVFKARSNETDSLRTAKQIEITSTVPVLDFINVSIAEELKTLIMDNIGLCQIKNGSLEELPETIQNLTITRNSIQIIEEGVFNNLTIKHLNLSSNKIQRVMPKSFDDMKNLLSVILDHNEIITYNFHFMNCPKLKYVSLQYNFLKELHEGVFRSLKDNTLTVKFSYNNIKEVHKLAFDIKEFKEVHLDHNELPNAKLLIKLVKADKVDLSDNHIGCLPKEFMENGLSKIKVLNITANPLNCSCLNDLRKKVRKNVEFQKMSPLVQNINIILPEKICNKK